MIDMFLAVDEFDLREFKACTADEIAGLLKMYDFKGAVPSSFSDFLLCGGHRMADMQPVSQFYYKSMINIKKDLDNGFLESFSVLKQVSLPPDGLIYCGSEGYYYEFITLSEDDPCVYSFDDEPDRENFDLEDKSFANRISAFVRDYLSMHEKRISGKHRLRTHINDFKKSLFDAIQFIENLKSVTNDDWLDQVLRWYYRARKEIYELYNDKENASAEISYAINNSKRIDMINIDPDIKKELHALDDELNKRFSFIKNL